MVESYKKVLSNMYMLTAAGSVFATLTAWLGAETGVLDSGLKFIMAFVLAIVLLLVASAKADTSSGLLWAMLFFGSMGLLTAPAIAISSTKTITLSLISTGLIFWTLSLYARWSKKDFTYIGGFLFIALIGILVLSVVNIFAQIPMLHTVISYAALLIFSLFVLHDTSEVITGKETNYVRASLGMFLNILNIFTALLSITDD